MRRFFAVLLVVLVLSTPVFATSYVVRDLGTLGGGTSWAYGLNNNGVVVGGSINATGQLRAFSWSKSTGMIDLGISTGNGRGINDSGIVIANDNEGNPHALVGSTSGSFATLKDLASITQRWSEPSDINSGGIIAGFSRNSAGRFCPVIWNSGSPNQVTRVGDAEGYAYGINDSGTVVGWYGSGNPKPFKWTEQSGTSLMNCLGSGVGLAYAINNNGYSVGYSYDSDWNSHACMWNPNGTVIDLGFFDGYSAQANDINTGGDVVGYSLRNIQGVWPAIGFLRTSTGEVIELPLLDGYMQSVPYRINDSGQIIGFARDQAGNQRAVLWEPVPEPSSLLALSGGLLGIIGLIRRRT